MQWDDSRLRASKTVMQRSTVVANVAHPFPPHMTPSPSATSTFWTWFQANTPALLAVTTCREPICEALVEELRRIAPELTFQFGPVHDGRREFVISADGIRDAFPAVEALAAAAPPLAQWTITRFRPGLPGPHRLHFGGVEVDSKDVLVRVEPDGDRIGLTVALPRFAPTPELRWEHAGFILLDMSLGEYLVETRIGAIDFVATSARPSGEWMPLERFAEMLRAQS